jgi:outer membrane lipoprotein SlyB
MQTRDPICFTETRRGFRRDFVAKSSCLTAISLALLLGAAALPAQQGSPDDGAVAMGAQGRMVRGTVTAVNGEQISVKTDAGDLFQVAVTTNTRLMKDRQPVKFADIHVGDGVGAMGVLDAQAKTVHAAAVFVVDAAQVKKMREDMGKTYISGKVTAIDELELTIHRQDGVTQKITVDEGTSFKRGGRRAGMAMRGDVSADAFAGGGGDNSARPGGPPTGGESITLADVKVGDTIIGPGALKSGVFVPTQITVIDAASMARRKRPEGSGNAPDQVPPGADPH